MTIFLEIKMDLVLQTQMLRIQKMDGDRTFLAFSDRIHCTRIRAEKNPCARNPMPYISSCDRLMLRNDV